MDDKEFIYKIVILDITSSGKTSLINRYINNEYDDKVESTFSPSILEKDLTLNNRKEIKLQLLDTIGRERFISVNKIFIKGAKGLIFLYDISKRRSLDDAKYYFYNIKQEISDDVVIVLVGNHLDIDYENDEDYGHREITREEGQNFANENNLLFYEVSAKNWTNVNEFFDELIQRIYENSPNEENDNRILNENNINLRNNRPAKRGCLK